MNSKTLTPAEVWMELVKNTNILLSQADEIKALMVADNNEKYKSALAPDAMDEGHQQGLKEAENDGTSFAANRRKQQQLNAIKNARLERERATNSPEL